jgi:branched-chain amino acid transport system permease protein
LAIDLVAFFEIFFNGIILGSLYGLMSSGYSLVYGVGKVANLAYGHMVVAAIFMSYLTLFQWNLNFFIGAPIAVAVAVLISMGTMVLLERVTDNEQRVIFVSLGLAIIIENVLLAYFGGTYRFAPTVITGLVEFAGIRVQLYRIIVFVCTLGIFGALSLVVAKTRLGRSMRAVSQSEDASWLMGIDVKRVKFATAGIAGLLADILDISIDGVGVPANWFRHSYPWGTRKFEWDSSGWHYSRDHRISLRILLHPRPKRCCLFRSDYNHAHN